MKKLLAIAAAFCLAMAMAVPAFAATAGATITISNAQKGETYTIYQIFDATVSGDKAAYKLMSDKTEAPAGFTVNSKGYVTDAPASLDADAKAALAEYGVKVDSKTATDNGELVFGGIDAGYYYITTTSGTLVTVDSATNNVTVQDKNPVPSIEKTAKDPEVAVGQNAEFTITITAQPGAKNYVLEDTMTDGLDFNNDITIAGLTAGTDYTVEAKAHSFTVTFAQSYLNTIKKETQIVVSYTAKVNKDAVVKGQNNDATLNYGDNSKTNTSTVDVTTTYFDLQKVDGDTGDVLNGAQFKLYADGQEVAVVKDGDYYRPAVEGETGVAIEAGTATVKGLDADLTYTVEETVAPDGYNQLTEQETMTLASMNTIKNYAGATLPTTGGMGTTILYVVGALLVIGAVVVLIARRRVQD